MSSGEECSIRGETQTYHRMIEVKPINQKTYSMCVYIYTYMFVLVCACMNVLRTCGKIKYSDTTIHTTRNEPSTIGRECLMSK